MAAAEPSCFQTLPAHIVSDILDYCAQTSDNNATTRRCRSSVASYCNSCRLWRQVGVKKSLKSQMLVVRHDHRTGKTLVDDSSAPYGKETAESAHMLAKTLHVRFESAASIFDGGFARALSKNNKSSSGRDGNKDGCCCCWDSSCYDNARRLLVEIAGSDAEVASDRPGVDSMAADACRVLRRLAPRATAVSVSVSVSVSRDMGRASLDAHVHESSIGKLISGLVAGMSTADVVCDSSQQHIAPAIEFTGGLVHLNMQLPVPAELLGQIVRRNKETLQSLHLQNLHPELAKTLVSDKHGRPLVYPQLRRLRFSQHAIFGSVALPQMVSDHGAPFPRLESLTIDSSYMFASDLVFRQTFASLRQLSLPLTPGVLKMASQSAAFDKARKTGTRISELRLETSVFDDAMTASYTIQATQLTLDLLSASAKTIRTLRLSNVFDKPLLLQAMRRPGGTTASAFTNLTNLGCMSLSLTMQDLVHVLSSIPRLTHLECSLVTDSPDLPDDAENTESLATYYSTTIFPLNKWFRSWHVVGYGNARIADMALAVLLVALACPRLCAVRHSPLFQQELDSLMHALVLGDRAAEGLLGRYRDRLCHLIKVEQGC
ncbi:hypothetical protein LPJ56_000887 [Coemansia sp. RSA 2599]|nr:hypothetical protein LPJ75_000484 [Coemansia sp. RSA 2598]KAJ1828788.1 hypothetical protein LPJ56_000887 [Coemansia sp. RSA 2599]